MTHFFLTVKGSAVAEGVNRLCLRGHVPQSYPPEDTFTESLDALVTIGGELPLE